MPDNSENLVWNTTHQGKRVPINNTGLSGAPVALGSQDPNWAEGSINKAVYTTHILTNTFPVNVASDAVAGLLDLKTLGHYLNKDMLYGYAGDARNNVPGDMMAYRGYPTPVIANNLFLVATASSPYNWNLDGSLGATLGEWLIFSHKVGLTYKLPYDFIYTTSFKLGLVVIHTLQFKIPAGMLVPLMYRLNGVFTNIAEGWSTLPQNKIFYSVNTTALTGNVTTSITNIEVLQTPYYGNLPIETLITPQTTYRPTVLPTFYEAGKVYINPFILDLPKLVNVCNEIHEGALLLNTPSTPIQLYLKVGTSYEINTTVYTASLDDSTLPIGLYAFAQWEYDNTGYGSVTPIYSVTRVIVVNSLGKITTIYNMVHSTSRCWTPIIN